MRNLVESGITAEQLCYHSDIPHDECQAIIDKYLKAPDAGGSSQSFWGLLVQSMPALLKGLLLTLAGRMNPDRDTRQLTVLGHELPRGRRAVQQLSAVAGFDAIDRLDESVTVADTLRRSATLGSNEAPGSRTRTSEATASAAAAIIESVTRFARATATPRPRPGKTKALLACAIR